jgi:DNA-binding XRE family transcriptional regulator
VPLGTKCAGATGTCELQKPSIETLLHRCNRAVAAVVLAARRDADLTQKQLADQMGIHRNTIVRIESGERSMTIAEFMLFARVLRISPTKLTPATRR